MAAANPVSAHPPYEHLERVVKDNSGRSLSLMKSYVDGIFFTDPVKLVVRDEDDRTILETEYGRELTVLCWSSRPCVVFRYDGLMPVLPQNVWRLRGSQLHEDRSRGLLALGVVAPFWDNAGGYLFALVSLGVPLLVLWLLSGPTRSPRRAALISFAAVGAMLYAAIWLYTVVLLSRVSLPLVMVVSAVGGFVFVVAHRAALRAGVAESTILKAARVAATVVVALAGVGLVALIGLFVKMVAYSSSIAFDEPAVHGPLAKARVTRAKGATSEVFATVAKGVKLQDVVNLALFRWLRSSHDPRRGRGAFGAALGPLEGSGLQGSGELLRPSRRTSQHRPARRVNLVHGWSSIWLYS
jgi:hypothetical protein